MTISSTPTLLITRKTQWEGQTTLASPVKLPSKIPACDRLAPFGRLPHFVFTGFRFIEGSEMWTLTDPHFSALAKMRPDLNGFGMSKPLDLKP